MAGLKIEAVITCVNFSDFLGETLDSVLSLVDDLVVVTAPKDKDTHRLCKHRGVRFVATNHWYRDDPDKFHKAKGINLGLAHLACTDWMLHIDADIWVPPMARQFLNNAELDPLNIYGCDRADCVGYDEWAAFKAGNERLYSWQYMVGAPRGWRTGARIVHFDYGGYCPIGFFQLWHADSGVTRYPVKLNGTAEHSDVLHALQWDRPRRVLLPEFLVVHLTSERLRMGADWNGRKTKTFGPGQRTGAAPSTNYGG